MPLISVENLDADVQLGLWRMDETDFSSDILSGNPPLRSAVLSCASRKRRAEITAVHSLLHAMTSDRSLFIGHTPEGRPFITGSDMLVSVSHTDGYAALMLSHEKNVAVDIEYVSDRVERIAGRFMRDDETATCTLSRLIHWCVKETVYKYFSGQNLGYHDIRLHAFRLSKEGSVIADNLRDSTESAVAYRVRDGYVLTYMFG